MSAVWALLGWRGTIALMFALGLAGTMYYAGHLADERDELANWQTEVTGATRLATGQPKLAKDKVALQISYLGTGVTTLKQQIDKTNREALQRAADFEKSKVRAQQELARMDAQAKVSDKRIERLKKLAERSPPSCEASPELMQSLEGL